jgi:hypothetical protein
MWVQEFVIGCRLNRREITLMLKSKLCIRIKVTCNKSFKLRAKSLPYFDWNFPFIACRIVSWDHDHPYDALGFGISFFWIWDSGDIVGFDIILIPLLLECIPRYAQTLAIEFVVQMGFGFWVCKPILWFGGLVYSAQFPTKNNFCF